jgi:glc operon protein GlcG
VSIAVVDIAGDLLAFRRMDHAPPASVDISMTKASTSARSRIPSKLLQDRIDGGQPSLLAMPGITGLQGGVPITVNEIVVGAIGVSGAQGPEDVQIATAGAAVLELKR